MADGEGGTRRGMLAAGLGLAALAAPRAEAAAMSDLERANLKVVNDFCAAWSTQDLARVMSFYANADNVAYRQSEAQPPVVGYKAVNDKIAGFVKNVTEFKVHDSWARGPMVINERTDYFTGLSLKAWHGVGVFLVQGGKIVEWYDYTIDRQRA